MHLKFSKNFKLAICVYAGPWFCCFCMIRIAIEMQFSVLKPIILNHIGIYAFNISCKVILFHNPYLSALVTSGSGMLVYAVISSWKILNNPLGNCAVLSASFSSGVLPFKFLQAVILKAFPSAVSTLKYAVSIMLFL